MPYANNKGTDQSAHPRSLISAFVFRCVDNIIPLLAIAEMSRTQLVSSAEQAGLSLNWSQTPETDFLMMWLKWNRSTRNHVDTHTNKPATSTKYYFNTNLGPNIHWTSNYGTGIVFIGNMLSWLSFHNFA